jgi:hypothetical protein
VSASDKVVEWTYGGDWGDKPNDSYFAFNGIVGQTAPKPALYEVKKFTSLLISVWKGRF